MASSSTMCIQTGVETRATLVLRISTSEGRVRAIVEKILASAAFTESAKQIAKQILESLSAKEAITALFFRVIGPVLERGDEPSESILALFDEAEKCYEEFGVNNDLVTDQVNHVVESEMAGYVGTQLELFQDEAATLVEGNHDAHQEHITSFIHRSEQANSAHEAIEGGVANLNTDLQDYQQSRSNQLGKAHQALLKAKKK